MKQLLTFHYQMYIRNAWQKTRAVASVWRKLQSFEFSGIIFGLTDFQIAPSWLRTLEPALNILSDSQVFFLEWQKEATTLNRT